MAKDDHNSMSKNIRSRKKANYLKPLSTDAVSCLLKMIDRVSFSQRSVVEGKNGPEK
jgi:hypothetical protein